MSSRVKLVRVLKVDGLQALGGVQAQEAVVSGVHESGIEYAESSDKPWWKCRQLG